MDTDITLEHVIGVPLVLGAAVVIGAIVLEDVVGVDLRDASGAVTGPETSPSGLELLYLGLAIGFGIVGLYTLARGLPALGRGVRLWRRDPVGAGSLHLESGVVEVEGEAEPIEEEGTTNAIATGTECLAYEYERLERRGHGSDASWHTAERATGGLPFYVTDDTGRVAVDPADATLSLRRTKATEGASSREWEGRLEPGDAVYVSGRKRDGVSDPDAPGGESTYIGPGDDAPSFTVSDTTESRTVLRFAAKGTALSGLGLLGLAASGALLLASGVV